MRFAAVLCVMGSAAQAACVTAADMERGVRVAYSDGEAVVVRGAGEGLVEVDRPLPGEEGAVMRTVLAQGIWDLELYDLGPDGRRPEGRMRWMYPVKPAALPVPVAGLRWEGWSTAEVEGTVLRSDAITLLVKEVEGLVVGDCAYPALALSLRIEPATEPAAELEFRYLPDIGVALRVGSRAGGEPPERREVVAIEALE